MEPFNAPARRRRKAVAASGGANCARGFTLVEAMVTIAVAGILTAVAAPSLNRFVLNNHRTSAVNDLVVSVQLARSEAVRRGRRVGLCPANSAGTECIESTQWQAGWIVYAITADGDEVIRSFPALEGLDISSDEPAFIYPPPTDPLSADDAPNLSLWTLNDSRGAAERRYVDVLPSGRPRVLCPGPSPAYAPLPCS
jgi:prepilin-type N-terminal cleavage/methylation domain-containing protein